MKITLNDLKQISPYEWMIEQDFFSGMNVPVMVFSEESMLRENLNDRSLQQATHAACLPGVVNKVCVMPDMHQGYGFPIGGVAATSMDEGVIVPGAIGYDINCGVRLLSSQIPAQTIYPLIKMLVGEIDAACPSGVGKSGRFRLSHGELEDVCKNGVKWAARNGLLEKDEESFIEDRGNIRVENTNVISNRAFERGKPQLGSLGAGNHFIEIDIVERVYNPEIAQIFGLHEGLVVVQIHSGSRGFGHQICTDFVRLFNDQVDRYGFNLPDRELACAPVKSKLGQDYLSAMNAAANFAFVNRQLLAYSIREAFDSILEKQGITSSLSTVYDLAHNIGKIEQLKMGGKSQQVCVHRKGATRALGPGNCLLPERYTTTGQPVLIPGSMGTHSWVMAGSNTAEEKSLNSCCHGAGRVMSRSKARKTISGSTVVKELEAREITITAGSQRLIAEEAPQAYKDVNSVVNIIDTLDIARKVALLSPIAVIKG